MTGEFFLQLGYYSNVTTTASTIAIATTQPTASSHCPINSSSIMSKTLASNHVPYPHHGLRAAGDSSGTAGGLEINVDEIGRRRSVELESGSILLPVGKNKLALVRNLPSHHACPTAAVILLTDLSTPTHV